MRGPDSTLAVEVVGLPAIYGDVEMDRELYDIVRRDLRRDLSYGPDRTTHALVDPDRVVTAQMLPRVDGILAGGQAARAVFDHVAGPGVVDVDVYIPDGSRVTAGDPVMIIQGPAHNVLAAERTAVNLMAHLSGVATMTARWVAAVAGTGCVIRDTRHTTPGMRVLQKYAVRVGGGANRRYGLGDQLLMTNNHLHAEGVSLTTAFGLARAEAHCHGLALQIAVDTLDQLDEALDQGAQEVLLSNFTVEDCAEAVRRRHARHSRAFLEAAGRLTLGEARCYATTGVDYLAVAGLTQSVSAFDISLEVRASSTRSRGRS